MNSEEEGILKANTVDNGVYIEEILGDLFDCNVKQVF